MNENNENNFKINSMSDFVDLKKWASLEGFDYTPPMQLFFEEFQADMDLKIENDAVTVCQRYGFEVDKEELKKALAYDRHQYEKGYHDARMAFEPKTGEWIITGEEQGALGIIYKIRKCDKCGWEHSLVIPKNFCPNCGAKMLGGEEND